jgi:hypothetical protein
LKRIPGPSGPRGRGARSRSILSPPTLSEAKEANVRGLHGAIPPGSEERFGLRMGGLISYGFFRPYAVTFDFESMTLYMKKAAKQGYRESP